MEKENRKANRPGSSSVVWRHLTMMLSVLLLAVAVLLIVLKICLNTLTKEYLSQVEQSVERDCSTLDNELFMPYVIPGTIENSYNYRYIRDSKGILDPRFLPVLPMINEVLNNEAALVGCADLTAVYLASTDSLLISGQRCYGSVSDGLRDGLVFSETGSQVLLGNLRQKNSLVILPIQPVRIGNIGSQRYLTVIIHPMNRNTAVLSLYTEKTIYEKLGMEYMPEGTELRLITRDGRLLLESSKEKLSEGTYYEITDALEKSPVTVSIRVPKSYFIGLIRPVKITGLLLILFVVFAGGGLSIQLSVRSVKPIQHLLSEHGNGQEAGRDEYLMLGSILNSASERSRELEKKLCYQILARVMSGGVLNESDEMQLQLSGILPGFFRIAIIHTESEISESLRTVLSQQLPGILWIYLNNQETGVLIAEAETEILVNFMNSVNGEIRCGISGIAMDGPALPVAVHQARISIPEEGVKIFRGDLQNKYVLTWLQHERLYQCIFSCKIEETMAVLDKIIDSVDYLNARTVYYNVLFILQSAATELKIDFSDSLPEYQDQKLPKENMESLKYGLTLIFREMKNRDNQEKDRQAFEIISYVNENAFQTDLCAATTAEHFKVTEKRIYETVRTGTGKSFNKYLLDLRMKKAAELLCSTRTPIPQIGEQCGYINNSTFYKAFKLYYGTAPGGYRKGEESDEI